MKFFLSINFFLVLLIPHAEGNDDKFAAPDINKKIVRLKDLDSVTCPGQLAGFACSRMNEASDPEWPGISEKKCRSEWCSETKTADEWTTCFNFNGASGCDRTERNFRLSVCTKCKGVMAAVAKVSPPVVTPPAPPVDTPPKEGAKVPTAPGTEQTRREDKDKPTCQGSNEQCFKDGMDTQRRAEADARARHAEYLRAMREARDNQAGTITSAAGLLDNWKHQLQSNPSAVTADERSRFANDQRVVQQAQAALPANSNSRGAFTAEDALRATDPGIMRQLSMSVEAGNQIKENGQEEKKSRMEVEKFHALADESQRRAEGMHTLPAAQASRGPTRNSNIATAAAGSELQAPGSNSLNRTALSSISAKAGDADDSSRGSAHKVSAPGAGGGIESGKIVGNAAGEGFRPPTNSLRDLLRKRLAANDANAVASGPNRDALDGASFDSGGLLGAGAEAGNRDPASDAGGKRSIAEDVMADFSSGKEKRFTMTGADNEAEVRRLTQDNSGPALAANDASLLGMNTQSLFERVRQAHRSCLQRDCVIGSKR